MLKNKVYIFSGLIFCLLLIAKLSYANTADVFIEGPFWFTLSSYILLLITAGASAYAIIQTRTVEIWKKHSEALKVQLDYLEERVSILVNENAKLKSEISILQSKTDISIVLDKLDEHNKESIKLFRDLSNTLNAIALTLSKIEKKGN